MRNTNVHVEEKVYNFACPARQFKVTKMKFHLQYGLFKSLTVLAVHFTFYQKCVVIKRGQTCVGTGKGIKLECIAYCMGSSNFRQHILHSFRAGQATNYIHF